MAPSVFTFHNSIGQFAANYPPTIEENPGAVSEVMRADRFGLPADAIGPHEVDMGDMKILETCGPASFLWTSPGRPARKDELTR